MSKTIAHDGEEIEVNGRPCRIINQATFSGVEHWGFQAINNPHVIGWIPKILTSFPPENKPE